MLRWPLRLNEEAIVQRVHWFSFLSNMKYDTTIRSNTICKHYLGVLEHSVLMGQSSNSNGIYQITHDSNWNNELPEHASHITPQTRAKVPIIYIYIYIYIYWYVCVCVGVCVCVCVCVCMRACVHIYTEQNYKRNSLKTAHFRVAINGI